VKKRNVGRLLKSGCNEEENEEILKLLFKTYQKKGNAPNFRKLVFSVFLSIVLPLAGFLRLQIIFNTNFAICLFTSFYVLFVGIVYFSFRNNRLFINDDFIIRQRSLGCRQ
jgi:putative membrane protein